MTSMDVLPARDSKLLLDNLSHTLVDVEHHLQDLQKQHQELQQQLQYLMELDKQPNINLFRQFLLYDESNTPVQAHYKQKIERNVQEYIQTISKKKELEQHLTRLAKAQEQATLLAKSSPLIPKLEMVQQLFMECKRKLYDVGIKHEDMRNFKEFVRYLNDYHQYQYRADESHPGSIAGGIVCCLASGYVAVAVLAKIFGVEEFTVSRQKNKAWEFVGEFFGYLSSKKSFYVEYEGDFYPFEDGATGKSIRTALNVEGGEIIDEEGRERTLFSSNEVYKLVNATSTRAQKKISELNKT